MKTRMKEHRKEVDKLMEGRCFIRGARNESKTDWWIAAVTDHAIKDDYVIDCQSAKIVEKEADWGKRGIGEAIAIRKYPNNMNRDKSRYFPSHLYDDLLVPRS